MADNKDIYTHTTSLGALERMLENGSAIKSLKHIYRESPDMELSVEPTILPMRWNMKASEAYARMKDGKDPDKIFFMRGKYAPNYGDSVITLENTKIMKPYASHFTLDNEYTTGRKVSLRGKGISVYVPDEKVQELQGRYKKVRIYPVSLLKVPPYTLGDRVSSAWRRITGAEKVASDNSAIDARVYDARYKRLFGRNARLVGSEALGISVPGSSDTDVFVPYKSRYHFDRAIKRIPEKYPELVMNQASIEKPDKKTFTGKVNGKDMDVVIGYGGKAQRFNEAFTRAESMLTPEQRLAIIRRKQKLKDAWVLPEWRYKRYKKRLAIDLGLADAYF